MDSWILERAAGALIFTVSAIWNHILADVCFDIPMRTNSQCLLKTIQNDSPETQHIRQQLESKHGPSILTWAPSHKDTAGNETADNRVEAATVTADNPP